MLKNILSCWSSTSVLVCSFCGHLFSGWRTEIYLQRSVHGWRLRRGTIFLYMGDHTIYWSVHHLLLRQTTIAWNDMYFVFFFSFVLTLLNGCVHLSYVDAECIAWTFWVIKCPLPKKIWVFRSCFDISILEIFSWYPRGTLSSQNLSRLLCPGQ
jgi:hypothetical protein